MIEVAEQVATNNTIPLVITTTTTSDDTVPQKQRRGSIYDLAHELKSAHDIVTDTASRQQQQCPPSPSSHHHMSSLPIPIGAKKKSSSFLLNHPLAIQDDAKSSPTTTSFGSNNNNNYNNTTPQSSTNNSPAENTNSATMDAIKRARHGSLKRSNSLHDNMILPFEAQLQKIQQDSEKEQIKQDQRRRSKTTDDFEEKKDWLKNRTTSTQQQSERKNSNTPTIIPHLPKIYDELLQQHGSEETVFQLEEQPIVTTTTSNDEDHVITDDTPITLSNLASVQLAIEKQLESQTDLCTILFTSLEQTPNEFVTHLQECIFVKMTNKPASKDKVLMSNGAIYPLDKWFRENKTNATLLHKAARYQRNL